MRTRHLVTAAALVVLAAGPVAGQEMVGDFVVGQKKDAMTDEITEMAVTRSDSEDTALVFICESGGRYVFVSIVDPVAQMDMLTVAGGPPEVQYRFDDQEPVGPKEWTTDDDQSIVAAPGGEILPLYYGAPDHERLTVRIWNGDGDVVTTSTFGLEGAGRAINRLSCAGAAGS